MHLVEGIEAGNWKPHTWDASREYEFIRNVRKHALRMARKEEGTSKGNEAAALVRGCIDGLVSAAMLKASGVKILGE